MSKPENQSTPPSRDSADPSYDAEATTIPRGLSAWFGGPNVRIGPRIAPQINSVVPTSGSSSDLSSEAILNKQIEAEANCAIQYRTCSWQKVRCDECDLTSPLFSVLQLYVTRDNPLIRRVVVDDRWRGCYSPNIFVW